MDRPTIAPELDSAALARLDGKTVLVSSTLDQGNPPIALRGTIEVRADAASEPEVRLALEFPQMFTVQAHHRTVVLDREQVARLLASECSGTFEIELARLD